MEQRNFTLPFILSMKGALILWVFSRPFLTVPNLEQASAVRSNKLCELNDW